LEGREPPEWSLTIISGLFSRVYFPITLLPENLRNISYILLQTYVLMLIREIMMKKVYNIQKISFIFQCLIFYSIIALLLGVILFRSALRKMRKESLID